MTQKLFILQDPLITLEDSQFAPVVTFAKIEGDTLDAVVTNTRDEIFYYQNIGTVTEPNFVLREDQNNPFNWIVVEDFNSSNVRYPGGAAEFVDINGDGNLDLFIGTYLGNILYFQNNPIANGADFPFGILETSSDPNIDPVSKPTAKTSATDKLFGGIEKAGAFAVPRFVDINGDGLMDLFVGRNNAIDYYKNVGTQNNPLFEKRTGDDNPFASFNFNITTRNRLVPTFADFDDDGDFDAFVGQDDGRVRYFENIGSATSPQFEEQLGINNPFNNFVVSSPTNEKRAAPYLADLNNDGIFEAFVTANNNRNISFLTLFEESQPPGPPVSLLGYDGQSFTLGDTASGDNLQLVIGGNPTSQIANIKIQIMDGSTEKLFSILPGGFIPRNFATPSPFILDFPDNTLRTGSKFVISVELFGAGGTTTATFDKITPSQTAGQEGVWTLQSSRSDLAGLSITLSQTDGLPRGNGLGVGAFQRKGFAVFELAESATGTFTVYREASFTNQIGLYRVDDASTGAIGSLRPGSPGYAQAAVRSRVSGFGLSVANQSVGSSVNSLAAGAYVPFMIVNGTFDSFLSQNPDNADGDIRAYFAYTSANPDGQVHAMVLGNNTFGFEDLFGGGDFDYNDLIVQVNFV